MPYGVFRMTGGCPLALFACVTIGFPSHACSEPRFGDSTWVAPAGAAEGSAGAAGPRVAPPDHERGWETALRTPFRVVFLPFRLLALGIEASAAFAERSFPPGTGRTPTWKRWGVSFSPELIGATASIPHVAGPGSKVALTGTWSPSDNRKLRLRGYVGQGVSTVGAGAEALYDYRPSRAFYGIGNFSGSRGTYYLRRTDLASVYAFIGQNQLRRARVTLGLSDVAIGNGGKRTPRSIDVFSPANVPFLTRGSRVWWYGSSANLGAVDDSLLPAIGVHFRPDVRRYRSSDGTNLRYDQWRLEARGYLPVFAKRRVLAGRLVYEGVDRRGGSDPVPFYRLPESSDADRFAAYGTGRFRDQRLAIGRAEYRWEIMPPLWAVALGELGEVASTSSRLTLRGAHPSLGGGLRAKMGNSLARLEIARGHEGLNIRADLGVDF